MTDLEYLLFLQDLRLSVPDFVTQLLEFVSKFGSILSIPVICYVYWSGKKEDGVLALWSFGMAIIVSGFLKQIMCVYRPWIRNPNIAPSETSMAGATGYSFPSSHSANASAYLGALAWQNRKRSFVFFGLTALILLVGFSRNYLGVHTPQDVIVGFACGVLSIVLSWNVLKWEQGGKNRDVLILIASIFVIALYLTYITCKSYPLDYDSEGNLLVDPQRMMLDSWAASGFYLGLVLSWLLEKRTLRFQPPTNAIVGLRRYIIGFIMMIVINHYRYCFCSILPENWGYFVPGFLTMLVLLYLYPALFTAIESRFTRKQERKK